MRGGELIRRWLVPLLWVLGELSRRRQILLCYGSPFILSSSPLENEEGRYQYRVPLECWNGMAQGVVKGHLGIVG